MFFQVLLLLVIFYVLGLVVVYRETESKRKLMNKAPSGEEAGLLLRMIIMYPFFYPEIDIILKNCEAGDHEDLH